MSLPTKTRVFVGDVQGCADELDDLLTELSFDKRRHDLLFTGDLVNRGPESLRALRTAIELDAESVLGNHDLHLIGRAAGIRGAKPLDTFDDILGAPDRKRLLRWLQDRPVLMEWPDIVLVHAGLHPSWEQPRQVNERIRAEIDWSRDAFRLPELRFAATVRHCDAAGNRPPKRLDLDVEPGAPWRPWFDWYCGQRTAVFGHWAQRGLVVQERLRGLDTGCVWGGSLTAWIAEEDRFVSVPARRAYQAQ